MKVFISSVRRGLEDERDALPGMIQALGHEPRRFEDYTARKVPSRQACLDGVEDADAYLLLLGEDYGEPLPDTGLSPTEEEFAVARRRGIPILAFRKRKVMPKAAQEEFIKRIENYATGLFRGSFDSAAELMAKVTAAIRELERAPTTLSFDPLSSPVIAPWRTFERQGWRSTTTILETLVIPLSPSRPTAIALSALPDRLARIGREHAFFADDQALDTGLTASAAFAATKPDRHVPIAGLGVTATGAVSIWHEMPSDGLGVILDPVDVANRIASMLRLGAELMSATGSVALTVGLHGLGSVTEGPVADLGRRTSASMPGFGYGKDALVDPRDSVPVGALDRSADEIGRELAARLVLRFRDVFR